jgi:phage terminase small subunit
MTKKSDLPKPPAHLRPETAIWWTDIVRDYDLEPSDLRVLESACTHWDRATVAREKLDGLPDGPFIEDRFGQLKEHPAVAIEQNATRLFLAALRQLGLGLEPSSEPYRLPNPTGRALREGD